jgi:hypothetical protein
MEAHMPTYKSGYQLLPTVFLTIALFGVGAATTALQAQSYCDNYPEAFSCLPENLLPYCTRFPDVASCVGVQPDDETEILEAREEDDPDAPEDTLETQSDEERELIEGIKVVVQPTDKVAEEQEKATDETFELPDPEALDEGITPCDKQEIARLRRVRLRTLEQLDYLTSDIKGSRKIISELQGPVESVRREIKRLEEIIISSSQFLKKTVSTNVKLIKKLTDDIKNASNRIKVLRLENNLMIKEYDIELSTMDLLDDDNIILRLKVSHLTDLIIDHENACK